MTFSAPPSNAHPAPLRRGMAIASLVLGIIGLPTLGLLLIGGVVGIGLGIAALMKASKSPQEFGGKGLAIGGIVLNGISITVMPVIIGIIAAIAIPSFLRARVSANESSAIGDARTMISAEAAYSSSNAGLFGKPACLQAPTSCMPSYTGPAFIDASLAGGEARHGYTATFHAGPLPDGVVEGAAPESFMSFAYVLVPVTPGQTGVRAFCGDSTGRVCSTDDGSIPMVADGLCDPSCRTLR